jgi:hypothetical protein
MTRTLLRPALFVAFVGVLLPAAAFGAHPIKSASYAGETQDGSTVHFRVAASGKRVRALDVPIPFSCQHGGIAPLKPGSAKVTNAGTFTAKLTVRALDGENSGTVTVTGKFQANATESGMISSQLTALRDCNATYSYSTSS